MCVKKGKILRKKNKDINVNLNSFSRRAIRNRVWEQRINSPLFNVRIYAKVICSNKASNCKIFLTCPPLSGPGGPFPEDVWEVQEGRKAITHNQLDFLKLLLDLAARLPLLALLPPRYILSGGLGLKLPAFFVTYEPSSAACKVLSCDFCNQNSFCEKPAKDQRPS